MLALGFFADIRVSVDTHHHMNLGSNSELNPDTYSFGQSEKIFYYRVPEDLMSGFYNLSLNVRDSEPSGGVGTGNARMFDKDRLNNDRFDRFFLFASTLHGTSYSVCVYPVISSLSHSAGSLAGSQRLTIRGGGFTAASHELTVLVGGLPCEIVSSALDYVVCDTQAAVSDASAVKALKDSGSDPEEFEVSVVFGAEYVPQLSLGSPGWWFKFWNFNDVISGRDGDDEYVAIQFGWRDRFYFSMHDYAGSDWPSKFGVSTVNSYFLQDASSVLTAPYSGYYTFYVAADDTAHLYGARASEVIPGEFEAEVLLAYTPWHVSDKSYYVHSTQISGPIALKKGEKYVLRLRLRNTGGYDYSRLGLKITPVFTEEGLLEDEQWSADPLNDAGALAQYLLDNENATLLLRKEANFPERLIQHHSKKAIQTVSLSMEFRREQQVLSFINVTGGRFQIIVQGRVLTEAIDVEASESTIRNALYNAAVQIESTACECLWFTVFKTRTTFGMDIVIQFDVDTAGPKTLLIGIDYSLVGPSPEIVVTRKQEHSPLPDGSFTLTLPNELGEANIPYSSSADALENRIEETFDGYNVEVTRSGFIFSGYTWTVTYATPRAMVPVLQVSSIDIIGPEKNRTIVEISTVVNASSTELFFDQMPSWLTAVSTKWATGNVVSSNVEVFRTSTAGDVMKAVCDSSGDVDSSITARWKGQESSCAYSYKASKTPVISHSTILSFVDKMTTKIGINGSGFSLGANNFRGLSVSIGEQTCNISYADDRYIVCSATSVPWGKHVVDVHVPGIGNAVNIDEQLLEFKQAVYSLDVVSGSMAGGQRINITGRGFRRNASISLGIGDCVIEHYSSSNIVCIAPPFEPKEVTFCSTDLPSSTPTGVPSQGPSLQPSGSPTGSPTLLPSPTPSSTPTLSPSGKPTRLPALPTGEPSSQPSVEPSSNPSAEPSHPLIEPSSDPSSSPTGEPSSSPTDEIIQ